MIEDYKRKEYIERVNPMDEEKSQWLLPHFLVIKTDRQTTKIRVVFDAAAKNTMGCLNDHIETGPKLQNDLVEIITRFRKWKIAIVTVFYSFPLKTYIDLSRLLSPKEPFGSLGYNEKSPSL